MVPRPLEQDPSGPDRHEPPASPGLRQVGFGRRHWPTGIEEARNPGTIALDQISLRIDDGLLMALGPDGDPLPPAAVVAAARAQPEAALRLGDGIVVPASRAVVVLEAQAAGPLAGMADGASADEWLRSMLGLGPEPTMATEAELQAEQRACELTAFARELMISPPAGGTFLITDAAEQHGASAALRLADGGSVSVSRLIERIRAEVGRGPGETATGALQTSTDIALPECGLCVAHDALVLELPSIGAVRLVDVAADAGSDGPRVSAFLANGEPVAIVDLIATLGGGSARSDEAGDASQAAECGQPSAEPAVTGEPVDPFRDWPGFIEAAADGTADLGVLCATIDDDAAASVLVSGVPAGAALSAGRQEEDGSWHLQRGRSARTEAAMAACYGRRAYARTRAAGVAGRVRQDDSGTPAAAAGRCTAV